MAKNLDIIKRAMKKLHVLPSGTEPSTGQAFDGMTNLQSLIVELIGQGSLGRLKDVLATTDYTAKEFDRIQYDSGTVTITLPLTITANNCTYDYGFTDTDYQTWYGADPRPPLNLCPIVLVDTAANGETVYNIWNTYAGAWVAITDLAQQDEFAFPAHLEDGFAALLAERWVDDWDQQLGAETKRQANACRAMLSRKPDSHHRNTSSLAQYM